MRIIAGWIGGVALSFGVLIVLASFGTHTLIRMRLRPRMEEFAARQESHLASWREDRTFLDRTRILASENPKSGHWQRDAGERLNTKTYWIPQIDEPGYGRKEPIISLSLREELIRAGEEWILLRLKKKQKYDVSLLEGITDYDHWNLAAADPFRALAAAGEYRASAEISIPDPADFISLAKIRLILGLREATPRTALMEVRALSRILISTENFSLFIAGLTLLDLERRAYREYVDRHLMGDADWEPYARNSTRRAQRTLMATAAYLSLFTSAETLGDIQASVGNLPGLCAAAAEQLPIELGLASHLNRSWWPFEFHAQKSVDRLRSAVVEISKVCRMNWYVHLADRIGVVEAAPTTPLILAGAPYFRRVFVLRDWLEHARRFDAYDRD